MSALLMRIIIAVVCVVLLLAVLPPFFGIVGFTPSGDVWTVLKICIAGLAVLYVIRGTPIAP